MHDATRWGVFEHAEWVNGAPRPTGHGYVARPVDCGVPYTRMVPVATFATERGARARADKLNGR